MTTPIYDALTLDQIAHLDFDPCQWDHWPTGTPCPHEAAWRIHYRVFDRPETILACTSHTRHMLDHLAACPNCPTMLTVRSVVRVR